MELTASGSAQLWKAGSPGRVYADTIPFDSDNNTPTLTFTVRPEINFAFTLGTRAHLDAE